MLRLYIGFRVPAVASLHRAYWLRTARPRRRKMLRLYMIHLCLGTPAGGGFIWLLAAMVEKSQLPGPSGGKFGV